MKTIQLSENFRTEVVSALKTSPLVELTFTKKDGSTRVLHGTLDETKMAADMLPKNKEPSKPLSESQTLNVYDIDLNEWRAARWDSIISVKH